MKKIVLVILLFISVWSVTQSAAQTQDLYKEQESEVIRSAAGLQFETSRENRYRTLLMGELESLEDSIGSNGNTDLHDAVLENDLESAERLLKEGVPVNITDENGHTALDLAARIWDLKVELYHPASTSLSSGMMELLEEYGGVHSSELDQPSDSSFEE